MPLEELVDIEKELERIAKEREPRPWRIWPSASRRSCSNESFVSKRARRRWSTPSAEKADKARALIAKLEASAAAMRG